MQTICSATPPSRPALAELTAAPDYAGRVTTITGRPADAEHETDAPYVLEQASVAMGLAAAVFVSFVHDDPSHESFRFLLACDPVWCFEYERRAWYRTDPWLAYAFHRSEPARGHEIPATSERERGVSGLALAAQFGFRSSLIVPAPSSGNLTRMGVLCLGSNRAGFFDDTG